MNRDRATGDHHYCRKVERMKCHPGNHAPALHDVQGETKYVGPVSKIAFQLEMYPAKNKRKGNQRRKNAAPHDQEVHRPSRESSLEDKALADKIRGDCFRSVCGVLHKLLSLEIQLPSTAPVNTRRRSLQPQGIAKYDCAEGDDTG